MSYLCSSFCSFVKGGTFIQGYLEDVLKQNLFDQIEFIFLDCNSPDNEAALIKPLAERFDNIKYVRLDTDPGLYAAWNIAVDLCSTDIIGNWNIDDRKSINSFDILLHGLAKFSDVDLVYGIVYVSHIENERYEDNSYELQTIDSRIPEIRAAYGIETNLGRMYFAGDTQCYLEHTNQRLLTNNSPHCMPLWRKRLHDKFGYFDDNYFSAGDAELWLRACSQGAQMKLIPHPVGLYYRNPEGRSTSSENKSRCMQEVGTMKAQYAEIFKNKGLVL